LITRDKKKLKENNTISFPREAIIPPSVTTEILYIYRRDAQRQTQERIKREIEVWIRRSATGFGT